MSSLLPTLLTTALLLVSTTVTAQVTQQLVTWGSVSVVYHGEKTPVLSANDVPYRLTPLGALQMYGVGGFVRGRYLNSTTGTAVQGMSKSSIDNSQLEVLSMDDGAVSASAMAFMQGLYPLTVEVGEESVDAGTGLVYQSPSPALNGYQYPALSIVSELDWNYLWVAGNIGCTKYSIARTESLISAAYSEDVLDTNAFYGGLADTVFSDIQASTVNYRSALDLYEYALYQSLHNTTLTNSTFTTGELGMLQVLASQQQFAWNTPASSSNTIGGIAGNTLASKVMQNFNHNIASSGLASKMTLLFSTHEPFLSFFSLANLSTGPSAGKFNLLPSHGSIMTFELFSYTTETNTTDSAYPDEDELWVQFLYRNGTSDDLVSYPLFRRGVSEVAMKWTDFAAGMGAFALDDIVNWCGACSSITLFCEAIMDNTVADDGNDNDTSSSSGSGSASQNGSGKTLSPVVAGVIGATITIATFIVIAAALLGAGFRMNYRPRSRSSAQEGDIGVLKRNGAGGFKGAEKLASDTDLRLKGGAGASVVRHERVGSWELGSNEGAMGKETRTSMDRVVSGADYGRRRSEDGDGDGDVDPFASPVEAVHHV